MSIPLHSICIPAYNHELFVAECLESIMQQTYPRLELIVVDDGSKDRTAQQVEDFLARCEDRFERIEFIRQSNQGIAATCNRLLELARGDWMHLIASDDKLYPAKVEAQWNAFIDWAIPDLAVVHSDMHMIDVKGAVVGTLTSESAGVGPVSRAYEQLLINNYVKAPTAMIRREALLAVGGYESQFSFEDYYCWLRLSNRFPIGRLPEILCGYRWHGGNISASRSSMHREQIYMHGKFIGDHADSIKTETIRHCYNKDLHRVWRWAKRNRKEKLLMLGLRALRSYISIPTERDFIALGDVLAQER